MSTSGLNQDAERPAVAGRRSTMMAIVQDGYGPAPEDVLRLAEVATPTIREAEARSPRQCATCSTGTREERSSSLCD
jgi:hypothetical protein